MEEKAGLIVEETTNLWKAGSFCHFELVSPWTSARRWVREEATSLLLEKP